MCCCCSFPPIWERSVFPICDAEFCVELQTVLKAAHHPQFGFHWTCTRFVLFYSCNTFIKHLRCMSMHVALKKSTEPLRNKDMLHQLSAAKSRTPCNQHSAALDGLEASKTVSQGPQGVKSLGTGFHTLDSDSFGRLGEQFKLSTVHNQHHIIEKY